MDVEAPPLLGGQPPVPLEVRIFRLLYLQDRALGGPPRWRRRWGFFVQELVRREGVRLVELGRLLGNRFLDIPYWISEFCARAAAIQQLHPELVNSDSDSDWV